jgi:hypothetical protein
MASQPALLDSENVDREVSLAKSEDGAPKEGQMRRLWREVMLRRPKWSTLPYAGQVGLSLVPATVIWSIASILRGRKGTIGDQRKIFFELAPSLMAAYGKSIGLIGVKDLFDELNKNLGVKLTLTRTYQVFSLLGYLLTTIAELYWTPAAGLGRAFFILNSIYTGAYAYMLFLTMVYNSRLEGGSRAFESSFSRKTDSLMRQSLNLPSLITWCTFQIITGYVWLNEARMGIGNRATKAKAAALASSMIATATSPADAPLPILSNVVEASAQAKGPLAKEAIAVIAFLLTSIGAMRSGFRTSMTSVPDISPFAGTLTLAMASLLSATALVPILKKSSIARIYLAGHASVIYSVLLNSYYAFKQQKLESKQRRLWKVSRRAKL